MREMPTSHGPKPITASSRDRVTGLDIRIDRVGEGDPVVFLNGLLGLNEHWFVALQSIVKRAECLLIQPPLLEMKGTGCSVQGLLRLTIGVVESLIEEPVVFVGNSLGGHIALRIAISRPDLVRGLVLIGSSGLFEKSFEKGVQKDPSYEWIDGKIRELFYDEARMRPELVPMAHQELSRRDAARAFVKMGRSAKRDFLADELHMVQAPTMLLWGRQDRVTPADVAEQFATLIPDAFIHWIERCGHAPQLECADEVGRALASFLDRVGYGRIGTGGTHAQGVA